jgi:hypothetical protein
MRFLTKDFFFVNQLAYLVHDYRILVLVIWYDMIWYDMIWYDKIWYDMIHITQTQGRKKPSAHVNIKQSSDFVVILVNVHTPTHP